MPVSIEAADLQDLEVATRRSYFVEQMHQLDVRAQTYPEVFGAGGEGFSLYQQFHRVQARLQADPQAQVPLGSLVALMNTVHHPGLNPVEVPPVWDVPARMNLSRRRAERRRNLLEITLDTKHNHLPQVGIEALREELATYLPNSRGEQIPDQLHQLHQMAKQGSVQKGVVDELKKQVSKETKRVQRFITRFGVTDALLYTLCSVEFSAGFLLVMLGAGLGGVFMASAAVGFIGVAALTKIITNHARTLNVLSFVKQGIHSFAKQVV